MNCFQRTVAGDLSFQTISMTNEYDEYLKDESRKTGKADTISFPTTKEEIGRIIASMGEGKIPVTVQGARTGITAGACPDGGHILNLSRMDKMTGLRYDGRIDTFYLTVQPGVLLSKITESLSNPAFDTIGWNDESLAALELLKNHRPLFFSPDSTETSASVGGMTACNASGACSFYYGAMRRHINAIKAVLYDGSVVTVNRGEQRAEGRAFILTTDTGRVIKGTLPAYRMPDVKNASGYFAKDDMDLVDLFIGSEGTLGVVAEVELRLLPQPRYRYGLMAFLPSGEAAMEYVIKIRGTQRKLLPPEADLPDKLAAIEFFDDKSLDLLRFMKKNNTAFAAIQEILPNHNSAVYLEYHGESEAALEEMVLQASELLAECGGDEEAAWIAMDGHSMEKLKFFRHALPEAVNLLIDSRRKSEPGISKLSTDMAVPDAYMKETVRMYKAGLEGKGLDWVMFGHIGNNHLHINILPRSEKEYELGRRMYLGWTGEVVKAGGTVSAEHGIGKLKKEMLLKMYGEAGVEQMRAIKQVFDPYGILNRGNLFDL